MDASLLSPVRSAARLAAAVLLAAACGPAEPPPPARFAVVQRVFAWEWLDPAPSAALSVAWTAADGLAAWVLTEGVPQPAPAGALAAVGTEGRVVISGPDDRRFDPDLLHRLVLSVEATGVTELTVLWRSAGEDYHEARSLRLPWEAAADSAVGEHRPAAAVAPIPGRPPDPAGAPAHLSVPLAALRGFKAPRDDGAGWDKADDAAEGFDALQLVFSGAAGTEPRVTLRAVVLASEFDAPNPAPVRLGRRGVYRTGVPLPGSGRLALDVDPGPADRLRLALAAVGTSAPQDVVLRDETGHLEQRLALASDGSWSEHVVDLAPLGGRPSRLLLAAPAAGEGSVVFVGSVLRLAPATSSRPNVVLYLIDTLRADHLGTYGHARPTDPRLAAIAAEGVVFERVIAAANWTRPATASVLTSLCPTSHGNLTHYDRVGAEVETLAEVLAAEGYVTVSFVTNYNAGAWSGLDQGFDVAREPPAEGASRVMTTLTSATIAAAIDDCLAEHADEQLLLYVHSMDPHRPYEPPAEDVAALVGTAASEGHGPELRYLAEIHHNDRRIGQLDDTLARIGLRADTLLVVTSDHGEAFGEHGQRYHRETLFQEELAVPWILRWPAALAGGRRVSDVVSHVDIAPTIVGLAGAEPPTAWEGRDLGPRLRGLPGAAAEVEPVPILVHTAYGEPREGFTEEAAVVRPPYKLIAWLDAHGAPVPKGLYDLGADPGERTNLLGDERHTTAERALIAWLAGEVSRRRAASSAQRATVMDPETRSWMEAMGYLR